MTAPAPLISVLMPSYNGARLIGETLASVRAQTLGDFEVIVVDDGSTDDTAAVVTAVGDPRIRLLRAERNGGPAVARSLAMAAARGRFIVGLDQDDLCAPDRFARQIAFLDAHPDHVMVASTIAPFGDGTMRADPYPGLTDSDRIDWAMLVANPLAWSTVMIRGEAARALAPFQRDEVRFAEDFDTYRRLRPFGRIGRIADPLVRYRTHAGSTSRRNETRMIEAAAAVLAAQYDGLFDGRDGEAGLLMSRHVAAGWPPPDAATLAACGRVLARLLDARGAIAPDYARQSASAHWWAIARSGLRTGRYGPAAIVRARPAFARLAEVKGARLARAALIGAVRRARGGVSA